MVKEVTHNSLKYSVSFRVSNRINNTRTVNQKYSLHQCNVLPDLYINIVIV